MRILVLISLFCLVSFHSNGQYEKSEISVQNIHSNISLNFKKITYYYSDTTLMPEYKGKVFLNKHFVTGTVFFNNGQVQTYPMRFNMYNNDIEFLNEQDKIRTIYKSGDIKKVVIAKDTLLLEFASINKKLSRNFFLIVYNGKTKVLELPKVHSFIDQVKMPDENEILSFTQKPSLLFILKDNREARLVKNKKFLLKIFADKKNELSAYINSNKLKVYRKEDLIKIVRYADSL